MEVNCARPLYNTRAAAQISESNYRGIFGTTPVATTIVYANNQGFAVTNQAETTTEANRQGATTIAVI